MLKDVIDGICFNPNSGSTLPDSNHPVAGSQAEDSGRIAAFIWRIWRLDNK